MTEMIIYYHTYYVSSGKGHRKIHKVYFTKEEADEHLLLMGGEMKPFKEISNDDIS